MTVRASLTKERARDNEAEDHAYLEREDAVPARDVMFVHLSAAPFTAKRQMVASVGHVEVVGELVLIDNLIEGWTRSTCCELPGYRKAEDIGYRIVDVNTEILRTDIVRWRPTEDAQTGSR